MTLTITLSDQQEYLISQQNPITWPTQVITGNFGDIILLNRGVPNSVLYYRDGSTFTVPGGLDATTGLPSGGNPYVCVAEGTVDLTDPLNSDFEEYGDIWWFRDPGSQKTPITIRSGDSTIYGIRVADFSVPPAKMSAGHQAAGVPSGAVGYIHGAALIFVAEHALDHLDWKIANAQGGDAATTLGGDQGAFFIAAAINSTLSPFLLPSFIDEQYGQTATSIGTWPRWGVVTQVGFSNGGSGFTSPPTLTISPPPTGAGFPGGRTAKAYATLDGAGHLASAVVTDPGSGYDYLSPPSMTITGGGGSGAVAGTPLVQGHPSSLIAFCNFFPGSYSTPSVLSSGSLAAGTYTPRYCYYKNLTLQTNWGTYTAVTETPLSTPDAITISGGQKIQFTMALPDSRWDGVRVYMANDDWRNGPWNYLQVPSTNYTVSATGLMTDATNKGFLWASGTATVIVSSYSAGQNASHGFSAWPSGTHLDHDTNAQTYALMKWAHVSDVPGVDSSYSLKGYQEGTSTNTNTNVAPASQDPKKMISNTPVTSRQSYMVVLGDNTGDSFDLAPQPVSGGVGDFKFEDTYGSMVAANGIAGWQFGCSVFSGLQVVVSPGSAYIVNNGFQGRFDHGVNTTLTMTASKDNYIDWDGTTFHVTAVAVGTVAPSVFLGSIRLFLVTTLTSTVQYIVNLYGMIPLHNILYVGRFNVTVANTSGVWSSASVSINLANGLFRYISGFLPRLWAQQAVTLGGVEATTVMTFLTDATSSNGGLNYSLLVPYLSSTTGTISFDVFATGQV